MKTLNITDFKEHGLDLANRINNEVASTQSVIIQPYPSEILMRRAQYDDLATLSGMIDMLHGSGEEAKPEDRVWMTQHNIMEIRIANA